METPQISKIGLVAFKEKQSIQPALKILHQWQQKNPEIQFFAHRSLHEICPEEFQFIDETPFKEKVDLIISLGGDGTFLSTVRFLDGLPTPIVGINLGRLGFLADISVEQIENTLNEIKHSQFRLTKRYMLNVVAYRGNKKIYEDQVLNEVVFTGKMGLEMIDLEVKCNEHSLTNYWVDGLIISTPTGSTAYSLSAGGPIIYPTTKAILLTPLNPRSLAVRPIVLPSDFLISVSPNPNRSQFTRMVTDGRNEIEIQKNDHVDISQSPNPATILRPKSSWFLDSIRKKLGWTGMQPTNPIP